MDAGNSGTATASENELVITRTFDAPRDLVWKAWTEDMDKWSAPPQFTRGTDLMESLGPTRSSL